ncbi:type II secretion system secretin GspD [Brevundimonas fluminis]|jgi:general secretion pathway protein D|uniref:type II secretion system secretin GspD n=1 Tax=Brevundimonas fluminis TaxID=2487274 RepID=UPI000F6563D2|nr:type II secretion system secretin GspD [Brevundimonas fluminis]
MRRFKTGLRGSAVSVMAALMLGAAAVPTGVMAQERQVLNVQGADIRAFIQDIARTTGRTFIVDPAVQGTVTVTSDRPLTRAEVYDVFLSTLRANGLVVIPTSSGAYRIAPAQGAAQGPATVGAERFGTEVFVLKNIDAASAAETIRPLIGAQGQVLANPNSNTIVVADFADNLRRVRELVRRIDVDSTEIVVVSLENSNAREIAGVLDDVLAPPGGQPGTGLVTVTAVESSNSIVLRGEPAALARVQGLIADLDRRALQNDDVRVIFLEHADAEQLLPVLQQVVGQPVAGAAPAARSGAVSSENGETAPQAVTATTATGQRASIARYSGANALIISAPPETQRMLAAVIAQLDRRRPQVLIEAIVVELSDDAVKELGVQWVLAGEDGNPVGFTNYSDRTAPLLPILGGVAANEELDADDPLLEQARDLALNSLLGANGFVGGGAGRIGDGLFGFIINAAKTDSGSNLLQTPSVITLDNVEANILVGQEVPVTTGDVLLDGQTNPFRTTERKEIGVRLTVRPQINAGDSVTLYIRQEVSSVNGILSNSANDLVFDTREIETTLVVDDGDIAVAGGLLDQNERVSVDGIPGLRDLPLVGGLFRSESRQRGRTNLMVFIRPTIIRTPQDAQRLSADRWGYMRDQQLRVAPDQEPSLDELLRDYIRTQPPVPPQYLEAPTAPVAPVEGQPLQ